MPRRQLPLSDLLRSVPDRPDAPCPPSEGPRLHRAQIDVRGPRFAAWVTSAVLAVALLTASGVLVAVQAAVFAVGAFAGLRYAPYGVLFRTLVAPAAGAGPRAGARGAGRGSPSSWASLFAVVGAAGYLLGAPTVGAVATGLALVAALLNAATGFCLGCELYLIARRALPART